MIAAASRYSLKRYLDTDTRSETHGNIHAGLPPITALTILCQADPSRVGEMAWLDEIEPSGTVELSRLAPGFAGRLGGEPRPLADPRLSRRPIRLGRVGGDYFIDAGDHGRRLEVDGEVVDARRPVSEAELERGLILLLGGRAVLCWHRAEPTAGLIPGLGLIGNSRSMMRLRHRIVKVADLSVPVLIRGETGTGKELVARAIHQQGNRKHAAFRSVNLGAVPESLAAAELFGATKGAYSGADRGRPGYFKESEGGTLFLDEIGEASVEVQAMLLRTLESGEIQPVGGTGGVRVDVRVLAATDVDLERAVDEERFRSPLLYRLQTFELALPPLRERIDDLGRLLFHFLDEALASIGEKGRSNPHDLFEAAYVPARWVARLALYSWPGNVRELRNVVMQAVIASRGMEQLQVGSRPEGMIEMDPPGVTNPDETKGGSADSGIQEEHAAEPTYRDPGSVPEGELRETLRSHGWNLQRAADALGISRTSLYELIERSPLLRTAGDLTFEELSAGLARCEGDLVVLARDLEVSILGLKRRLKSLGLR